MIKIKKHYLSVLKKNSKMIYSAACNTMFTEYEKFLV